MTLNPTSRRDVKGRRPKIIAREFLATGGQRPKLDNLFTSAEQAKLATIDTEVAKIRDEARRAAALEAERIKGLARAEAEMIERAAQAEVAATEHAARLELKTLAAGMAVERAEALLRTQLQPKVESTRFFEFVTVMSSLVGQRQAKS